jgi:hypothetical protein
MTQMTHGLRALAARLTGCAPGSARQFDNLTQRLRASLAACLAACQKKSGGVGADGRPVTLAEGPQTKFILLKSYRCKLFIFYAKMRQCSKPCHTSRVSCKRLKTDSHAYTKQRV